MKWDGQAYAEDIKYGLLMLLSDDERASAKTMKHGEFTEFFRNRHKQEHMQGFCREIGSGSVVFQCNCDCIEFDFQRSLNNFGDRKIVLTWSMAARHIRYWVQEEMEENKMSGTFNLGLMLGNHNNTDSAIKIEMLDPSEIELFSDENGNKQPDEIQEDKVLAIMASAEDIGILQPCVIRLLSDGRKQMLSGRHRREAAIRLGQQLPCEIRCDVDDVTAYKIMAESNPPGREKFPSELGKIYAKYLEMRTSGSEEKTAKEIAAKFSTSEKSVYRYAALLQLPPKLQNAVDFKIIPIGKFERLLNNLTDEQLIALGDYIEYYEIKKLSAKKIDKLVIASATDQEWNDEYIDAVLYENPDDTDKEEKNKKNNSDRLILKIRMTYPETQDLSEDELDELVMNLLAEHFS